MLQIHNFLVHRGKCFEQIIEMCSGLVLLGLEVPGPIHDSLKLLLQLSFPILELEEYLFFMLELGQQVDLFLLQLLVVILFPLCLVDHLVQGFSEVLGFGLFYFY